MLLHVRVNTLNSTHTEVFHFTKGGNC